jgi:hypothetical protein
MKIKLTGAILAAFALSQLQAHNGVDHSKMTAMHGGRDVSKAALNVAANAAEPVAAVERFSAAIGTGDLTKAGAELDANVVILESGGAEHSSAEYLAGHAKADADFLKTAHVMLKNRIAVANADIAWVTSESEIHTMREDKMLTILSTETMVLKKVGMAWKIVHIHWSSRAKK